MEVRKAYPYGAKDTFNNDYGVTTNGKPPKATGTVSYVMTMPNGRRQIGILCERWKGL